MTDPATHGLDDTTVDLEETTPRPQQAVDGGQVGSETNGESDEANLIVIAHPEDRQLGRRFRVVRGSSVKIGRSKSSDFSFPEVLSLSRDHGRLVFDEDGISFEDLGSTNGSFVNDERVTQRIGLASGDRIQLGALHLKFLHGLDVEHAYYEAIYNLMTQDGLTEISNRRSFDEELYREFARSKRHQRPLTLILFDIDHFKMINDRCGHLCGDFVLKRVVAIVGKSLRTEQVFARIGGDEFAIINPEIGLEGAVLLADKLRAQIAAHDFDPDMIDGQIRATCSFGVAAVAEEMNDAEEFFSAADQALYESKNLGRNRVTPCSNGASRGGPSP